MPVIVHLVKRNSLKIIVLIVIVICIRNPVQSFAQSKSRISGKVTGFLTAQPIHYANVFLSGTTLGDVSGKDGRYLIVNIPPGSYEMVVSFMGYEPAYQTIHVLSEEEKIIHFQLKSKVLPGDTISITTDFDKEWQKNLEKFKQLFFGSGQFADECTLQNPEFLEFKYKKLKGSFEASNQDPVTFVNNAMGYRISFILIEFYSNKINKENFRCAAVTWFEELEPKSEIERKKWLDNRLLAYNGSIRHFMKSLWKGQLKEEGFEIYRLRNKREVHINPDTLLSPTEIPDLYIFKPQTDLLKIIYKNERDEESLQEFSKVFNTMSPRSEYRLRKRFSHQVTSIKIQEPIYCTISESAVIIPQNPITFGYWSRDLAPQWLPADYKPPIVKGN